MTPAIDLDELVTQADIARKLGLTPQRVNQLVDQTDFPDPIGKVARSAVWSWPTVEQWALARNTGQLRQGVLTHVSDDRRFTTDTAAPGVIHVQHLDGSSDGSAIAWAGTPIIELRPHESGVTVITHRLEGEIAKNTKGNWVLTSSRERSGDPTDLTQTTVMDGVDAPHTSRPRRRG